MSVTAEPVLAPIAFGVGFKPQLQRWNTFTAGDRSPAAPAERSTDLNSDPRIPQLTASRELSIIEIETRLRECLRAKYGDVLQAFQNYDENRSMSVSKGQLRRVLELHCMPLTSQQYDAILNKISASNDGTIRYCDFLDRFCGTNNRAQSAERWKGATLRCDSAAAIANAGGKLDIIEKMLQDKIQSRLPDVLESLRLYDFSRDGTVQRHVLHRVLDRQCFELSDDQFDRIYQKYDLRRNGSVNYKEFLNRLGVRFEKGSSNRNGAVVIGSRPSSVRVSSAAANQDVKTVPMSDADLYEIEVEFRKKMRDNFANVKRMFMAFDRHLNGFISLDDLKSVLNNFTVPMSDQLFANLMARFGFKATGKVSWEFFLSKFQDPLAERNGQTIPIKPSHKFFPNRGADEELQFTDVVKLLVRRLKSGYSTLKNAFLQLDKNRDGKISRRELRTMLEQTFSFHLTPEHFDELMLLLDPQGTNTISYHDFLDLFEQRESLGGHKWLNTCHRTNAHKTALIAWSTLESNIRDQVELHRSDVIQDLERYDVQQRGWVTLKVLRKIIEKHAVPVTDEHFSDMVERLAVLDDVGLVNYVAFFLAIGVTLKPDDSHGVSSQIMDGSKQTAENHRLNQQNRLLEIEQRALDRTFVMELAEIITRLRDKMAQKSSDLHRAFRFYSNKHRGRITKKDFRKILESYGFHLPDEQFEGLCEQLNFNSGHMSYTDFVRCFEDRRPWSPTTSGENTRPPNHHVNEIRGDELGMSAVELESKLRQKFDENFDNLRDVFQKFDTNSDGVLTKSNFRNMLNSFMLIATDDEFEKFCAKLGIDARSRITYQDFLDVFQLRETKDGHTWLTSTHRFNQAREAKGLDVNETRCALKRKLHESSHDLAKALGSMAAKRHNGTITRSDLRKVLSRFSLKLDKDELDEMWTDIDVDGQGSISYNDFMQYLMADEFAPGDSNGISRRIMKDNRDTLKELRRDQVRRQTENQLNEAHHVTALSTDDIIDRLRNHFQDQFTDLQAAFKRIDSHNKGYLTSKDFQKMLGGMNLLIDDDQLFDLFDRLNLRTTKAKLSYEEFVHIFEEGRTDTFKVGQVEDAKYPTMQSSRLTNVEIETRLRHKVEEQQEVLLSACRSFDQKEAGLMRTIDLRRVLDLFLLRLTDEQFRHLMKMYSSTKLPYEASSIDYKQFLERFKSHENQKMPESLANSVQSSIIGRESAEELLEVIRHRVADRTQALETSFTDVDFANLGVVQMRDFRDVLGMHGIILNDEQFTRLWSILPVNEFSNLDYRAFLISLCSRAHGLPDTVRPVTGEFRPTSTTSTASGRERTRPITSDPTFIRVGSSMSRPSTMGDRPYTPLVNAEGSESKVHDKVRGHWQALQRYFRQLDADNTGVISQQDFKDVCAKYNFGLTEDETRKLILKYDLKNNATFCYVDFIHHFVLPSSAGGRSSRQLLRRTSSGPNVLQVSSQDDMSAPPPPALEKIRSCISGSWKNMRRDLRADDPSGLASADQFRQALRNVNVDMDEEEFFDIAVYFEDRKSRKIRYDDFFRYFLQRS